MNKPKKPIYKRGWFIAIVVILIAAALTGGGDENGQVADKESTNAPTENVDAKNDSSKNEEPKAQEPEKTEYKAGMYKVGTDMPAGEYALIASGLAYLEVASDSSGNLESIVANDNFSGTSIITISDGQYFKIQSAKAIPIAEVTDELTPKDGVYKDGMWRVGTDIPAGEYKVSTTGGMGYIEIDSDSTHSLMSIVANSNPTGEVYQTLTEGTYLKLSNGSSITIEQ